MVARLIEESVGLLKPGGHLILEIGTDQEEPVRSLIEAQPGSAWHRPSSTTLTIRASFARPELEGGTAEAAK